MPKRTTSTTDEVLSTDAIIENHYQQERNTIHEQYQSLDTEHKGYVTLDDLRRALRNMGLESNTHPLLKPMIQQLETDLTQRRLLQQKRQKQQQQQQQQQQHEAPNHPTTTTTTTTNQQQQQQQQQQQHPSSPISPVSPHSFLIPQHEQQQKAQQDQKSTIKSSSSSSSASHDDDIILEFEDFYNLVGTKNKETLGNIIQRAFTGQLAVPDWKKFCTEISHIFELVRHNTSGQVASYIPQLAEVDPSLYGLSICTVDGQEFSIGDSNHEFTIQSCAKVFSYCVALDDNGVDNVHRHVGFEPSGTSFNAFTLDRHNKPHNPMINAGAIAVCSLIQSEMSASKRFTYISDRLSQFAGGAKIGFDNAVFLSEKDTADRNFALGYYMQENDVFPKSSRHSLDDTLDFYFQLCSILVTTQKLATMGATLANGGVCPLTNKYVVSPNHVKCALQLMLSCGMYDFSGEWSISVGLPAKSGVAGACCVVIPGVMSVCIFSPRLDRKGNSVRAVEFCTRASTRFKWSIFDQLFLCAHDEECYDSDSDTDMDVDTNGRVERQHDDKCSSYNVSSSNNNGSKSTDNNRDEKNTKADIGAPNKVQNTIRNSKWSSSRMHLRMMDSTPDHHGHHSSNSGSGSCRGGGSDSPDVHITTPDSTPQMIDSSPSRTKRMRARESIHDRGGEAQLSVTDQQEKSKRPKASSE